MARNWIVVGDPTSSGGSVVTGSPFTDIDGIPVARVTDQATCPRHKGAYPIVDGDSTLVVDGQPVALHGSSLSCGCKVLSAQQVRVFVDVGAGGGVGGGVARDAISDAVTFSPSPTGEGDQARMSVGELPPSTVTTGLGADVDAIAVRSPSLQSDMRQLQKDGWVVEYGQAGEGSFADRESNPPRIVIDGDLEGDPAASTQVLAHEVGHATYPYAADFSSKEAYVNGALADEGAATLNNIKVQREILANGGPDIGLAGSQVNHAAYNAAYDQYLRDGDVDAALRTIGSIFASGETPSGAAEGQSYYNYYGDWYDEVFGGG